MKIQYVPNSLGYICLAYLFTILGLLMFTWDVTTKIYYVKDYTKKTQYDLNRIKNKHEDIEKFIHHHNRLPNLSEMNCDLKKDCQFGGFVIWELVDVSDKKYKISYSPMSAMFSGFKTEGNQDYIYDPITKTSNMDHKNKVWKRILIVLPELFFDFLLVLCPFFLRESLKNKKTKTYCHMLIILLIVNLSTAVFFP